MLDNSIFDSRNFFSTVIRHVYIGAITLSIGLFAQLGNASVSSFIDKNFIEFSIEVSVNEHQSLHKVRVPEFIQEKMQHTDASDLYVLDRDGAQVPSKIVIDRKSIIDMRSINVAIFLLDVNPNSKQNDVSLSIDDGKLEVRMAGEATELNGDNTSLHRARNVIIDGAMDGSGAKLWADGFSLSQLRLQWNDGFEGLASYELLTSDNLNDWVDMGSAGTVAHLGAEENNLHRDSIDILHEPRRYMKLVWLGDNFPVINTVTADYSKSRVLRPNTWSQPNVLSEDSQQDGFIARSFSFKLNPAFQSDMLKLLPQGSNTLFSGSISVRNSREQAWRKISVFEHYMEDASGGQTSTEIPLYWGKYQEYSVQFDYPQSAVYGEDFLFELSRYPMTLYFLDANKGPYTLAFSRVRFSSNAADEKTRTTIKPFADVVAKHMPASNEEGRADSININEENLKHYSHDISKKINWLSIVLRIILFSGAALMLLMARKLFKSLNSGQV